MGKREEGEFVEVNGVNLWVRVTGEGEPMIQIHGAGFGHFNLEPGTAILSKHYTCIDYDQRGYGYSDRPHQDYNMDVWGDDAAELIRKLGYESVHVHGTSMGGMVAINLAARYPELVRSVIINCSAAKLGRSGQLIFQNWIDLAEREGVGSRTLAELIGWQALSREFAAGPGGADSLDMIQTILRDSNDVEVFTAACRAMNTMDQRDLVKKIKAPTLVLGGDQDVMTPWDQGPGGAGQQWIFDNLENGYKYLIQGSNHSTLFDNTEEHCAAVMAFLLRTAG